MSRPSYGVSTSQSFRKELVGLFKASPIHLTGSLLKLFESVQIFPPHLAFVIPAKISHKVAISGGFLQGVLLQILLGLSHLGLSKDFIFGKAFRQKLVS